MSKYPLRFTNEDVRKALQKSAQSNHRSLNSEIMRAIEFYLKEAPDAQYEVKPKKEVKKSTPP